MVLVATVEKEEKGRFKSFGPPHTSRVSLHGATAVKTVYVRNSQESEEFMDEQTDFVVPDFLKGHVEQGVDATKEKTTSFWRRGKSGNKNDADNTNAKTTSFWRRGKTGNTKRLLRACYEEIEESRFSISS
jgi:hypothetical protein